MQYLFSHPVIGRAPAVAGALFKHKKPSPFPKGMQGGLMNRIRNYRLGREEVRLETWLE